MRRPNDLRNGIGALGTLFAALWLVAPVMGQTIDDFDRQSLGDVWTAIGKTTTAKRIPVPEGLDHPGVTGHFVHFEMDPGGRLVTRSQFRMPPVRQASSVKFAIRAAEATLDAPVTLECQFFCSDRRAWRWCKFELTDTQWHTIELPLRYFRHSEGAYVDWSEVTRVGLMTRTAGEFQWDALELVQDADKGNSDLSPDELGQLAFGDRAQLFHSQHFSLITDCRDLESKQILSALEELYDKLTTDLPELQPLQAAIPLMIFAEDQTYQEFFGKLEPLIRSTVNRPRTPGYTLFGIACCVYSNEFGPVRPIYIHEACHALVARGLGLGNQGEWLHEGLANHYQTTLLQQEREGPARFVLRNPVGWAELLAGERIPLEQYAHAMFFVEWMMSDEHRRESLGAAMKQMRQRSSTRFDEQVVELLGESEDRLQASFKLYVQSLAGQ